MIKRTALVAAICCSSMFAAKAQELKPYGALPTQAQLDWQNMEYYMFIHFGPNTFTDKEWGHGDEDPKVFNPTQLDARQWARTAKQAGMKGIIITAKHHDGFCLWPSEYSTHTVRESSWKNGKGDVLAELSAACKEYGLKFGVYLSPWDRNHPKYGTEEYNDIFAKTLTEVHTKYGDVFEQWFDGANGEGPNGKKQVYNWPLFHNTVYKYHPNAIIFSDNGPGCRWIGNEQGFAGTTNWSTLNGDEFYPGKGGIEKPLNEGQEDGKNWIPGEADVSIRPGWFFSPSTNDKVKTTQQLLDIYYGSVGRNANLLLNVPVDRRGLIHANDSTRLMEFRKILDATFKTNVALRMRTTATSTRISKEISPIHLTDGNPGTYWAPVDGVKQPSILLSNYKPVEFNRIVLREYLALGQRVKSFKVEVLEGKTFKTVAEGTTIGHKRIFVLPNINTRQVRVTILDAKATPIISEIELYKAPEVLAEPFISRSKDGKVSITCPSPDPQLRFTLDGSEPTALSPVYTQAFAFPAGGEVKAKAFINNGAKASSTVSATYDVAPAKWKVIGSSDEVRGFEAEKAIDGDPATLWLTNWKETNKKYPHEIQVDLGEALVLKGFTYLPRKENNGSGNIEAYEFYISNDGQNWGKPVSEGHFANIKNNPIKQTIRFNNPFTARFIKLVAVQPVHENEHWAGINELGVITR
ncbi:alpha-L-fucosidase [Chitinophaga skermanii]|uniref:alpha-L-fucosidase n=1 Tax=Chitinophaga skermanii TaxID=331697 RepID=A0A327Q6G9_9BACT|nr:discoidin domain-containing protein [Chitinophaga skermanii]RAI99361.1 alpha-L-fucosidase [Chitinophaga skermanii]